MNKKKVKNRKKKTIKTISACISSVRELFLYILEDRMFTKCHDRFQKKLIFNNIPHL